MAREGGKEGMALCTEQLCALLFVLSPGKSSFSPTVPLATHCQWKPSDSLLCKRLWKMMIVDLCRARLWKACVFSTETGFPFELQWLRFLWRLDFREGWGIAGIEQECRLWLWIPPKSAVFLQQPSLTETFSIKFGVWQKNKNYLAHRLQGQSDLNFKAFYFTRVFRQEWLRRDFHWG